MSTRGPIATTGGWDNPTGRNLSQQERDTIRKLVEAGQSHREIGIRIGRGKATVGRAARAMGFKPAQAKRLWTVEEDHRLIHLVNQGLSQRKIAVELGRHHAAISYRIWYLRSRAEADKEIHYLPVPSPQPDTIGPATVRAPKPQRLAIPEAPPEPSSLLGLPTAPDLWDIWNRRVFGVATMELNAL